MFVFLSIKATYYNTELYSIYIQFCHHMIKYIYICVVLPVIWHWSWMFLHFSVCVSSMLVVLLCWCLGVSALLYVLYSWLIPAVVQFNGSLALLWHDVIVERALDSLTRSTRPQVTRHPGKIYSFWAFWIFIVFNQFYQSSNVQMTFKYTFKLLFFGCFSYLLVCGCRFQS